ncbi:DUF4124 domain-containing protein [Massilia sp. W12]|uniref:DUF4124 domain-containing protein n=1 Tax=Massilia sp. W12 TaxID=3126507 RepID=UPI0030CF8F6F
MPGLEFRGIFIGRSAPPCPYTAIPLANFVFISWQNSVKFTLFRAKMNTLPRFKHSLSLLVLSLFCAAAPAHAQYVWLDEKGVKQFSDQPPPASVPKNKILKAPGVKKIDPAPQGDAASAEKPEAAKSSAPPSTADRNTEFNKRQKEAADKEKKSQEESKLAQEKKQNCQRMRNYQRTLEDGGRISGHNDKGEKIIYDETRIAEEKRRVREALSDCN